MGNAEGIVLTITGTTITSNIITSIVNVDRTKGIPDQETTCVPSFAGPSGRTSYIQHAESQLQPIWEELIERW